VVLYCGKIVETGRPSEVFRTPLHPYTAALVSAVPVPDVGAQRRRIVLPGDPPSPTATPKGCSFHPRCPIALERCRTEASPLIRPTAGRRVACHTPGDLQLSC
jgi:oligopeptide/dipeptide ABC transporter ATP-binding protein